MKRVTEEQLLREYVRHVLSEDEGGGGDYGGGYGGYGYAIDMDTPFGVGFGGPSLWKTFIEPFTDVVQTAKAGAENVAVRVRTALKVALETAVTTVIPFLSSDYKQIFEKEQHELQAIKEKYREVFERTEKILGGNDFKMLAFIYNPTAYVTTQLARKAPDAALEILEVVAGQNETLRNFVKKFTVKTTSGGEKGSTPKHDTRDVSIWTDARIRSGRRLAEAGEQQQKPPSRGEQLAKALSDPQVQQAFKNSDVLKAAKADANKVVAGTLKELIAHAQKALSVNNVQALKGAVPGVDLKSLDQLQGAERQQAEKVLMKQVHDAAKNMYVQMLQEQIKTAKKSGADDNNPLVVAFGNALKKIQSM